MVALEELVLLVVVLLDANVRPVTLEIDVTLYQGAQHATQTHAEMEVNAL